MFFRSLLTVGGWFVWRTTAPSVCRTVTALSTTKERPKGANHQIANQQPASPDIQVAEPPKLAQFVPNIDDETLAACGFQPSQYAAVNGLFQETYLLVLNRVATYGTAVSQNANVTRITADLGPAASTALREYFERGLEHIAGKPGLERYRNSEYAAYIEHSLFSFAEMPVTLTLDTSTPGITKFVIATEQPVSARAPGMYYSASEIPTHSLKELLPEVYDKSVLTGGRP